MQERVRRRVLRDFVRHGLLELEDAQAMLGWDHGGGFSIDASVRIEDPDREGLERLLRDCARGPLALERLDWAGGEQEQRVYEVPKPLPDGQTVLLLTPLEWLERLAALIPPPRIHRHRYFGVRAPNAPLRSAVTATASRESQQTPPAEQPAASPEENPAPAPPAPPQRPRPPSAYLWVMLLARIDEVFALVCCRCGEPVEIIALITEPAPLRAILAYIGEPLDPPVLAPARGPPAWEEFDQTVEAIEAQPVPEMDFEQTLSGSSAEAFSEFPSTLGIAGQLRLRPKPPLRLNTPFRRRQLPPERLCRPVYPPQIATFPAPADHSVTPLASRVFENCH